MTGHDLLDLDHLKQGLVITITGSTKTSVIAFRGKKVKGGRIEGRDRHSGSQETVCGRERSPLLLSLSSRKTRRWDGGETDLWSSGSQIRRTDIRRQRESGIKGEEEDGRMQ